MKNSQLKDSYIYESNKNECISIIGGPFKDNGRTKPTKYGLDLGSDWRFSYMMPQTWHHFPYSYFP